MQEVDSAWIAQWDRWHDFNVSHHFATRCKIAENIRSMRDDIDEKKFDDGIRHVLENNINKDVSSEFKGFAIKIMDGEAFHIFFMDKDSIPIDYAFNVPSSEVIEIFKALVYRFNGAKASMIENGDGILFHRRF